MARELIPYTDEQLENIFSELTQIRAKKYDIGDVSQEMKELVHHIFGKDDYSTSGYWVRAEEIFKHRL